MKQEVASPGAAEEVREHSGVLHLYRRPGLSPSATKSLLRKVRIPGMQLQCHLPD